ncbi:MAG: diguanylate cyclase [Rhodanobacteraceae bacterium]|nr:diguanylate cyclase [Rhodanobacteraceae bacterium]
MTGWVAHGLCALALLAFGVDLAAAEPTPLDVADQGAPTFTVFTARDGLSDEIWGAVDVDARGIAWAGSASGLARFDGYRWTLWPTPDARSLVRDLERAPDGRLWAIFEREGLAELDGDIWRLHPQPAMYMYGFLAQSGGTGPRQLMVAHTGRAWQWEDGQFQPGPIDAPAGTAAIRIARTETLFGSARLWVATTDGLWFRSPDPAAAGNWQRFDDPRLKAFNSTDLLRTSDGDSEELWALSYGSGIVRIRNDGIRAWRAEAGELPTEAIYAARATHTADGERLLWIASRAGLLLLRGDQFRAFDRRHGLPSDAVRALEVQRNVDGVDLLWLATEGGIVRATLGHNQWQTVSLLGARENGIFGLLLEPDGRGGERLWVGTAKEGLNLLQGGTWHQFSRANGELPLDSVRKIVRLPGPDGNPWRLVSVFGGLYQIDDPVRFTAIAAPWDGVGDDTANSIIARQLDGVWEHWFGSMRSGIHRLRQGKWTQFVADGAPLPWTVMSLAEQLDADGRSWLWAASSKGLARFDGERWTLLPESADLPADGYRFVNLIADGERSVLWVGSNRHGLMRLDVSDPLQPRVLDAGGVPSPPDPTIYSVLPDRDGRIYVCTNNGVQQLTPTGAGSYSERVFRRRDGLVHDECNTNSQFIDAQQRYWVGTLGGLSVFDPRIETPDNRARAKPIYLTEVMVNGQRQTLDPGEPLLLPAGTREFGFGYALLAGQRERESVYRSQLIGYDPEPTPWTDEHRRNFTGLPPGKYRLQVAARDYAGTPSAAELLTIEILPYWWQRPLLQTLLVLSGLLALMTCVMIYNRGLRARQRRLKREVAARTAELDAANQRLTELSYQDPLTGVANRRRLMEALDAATLRAHERQLPIGLIVIDVDHFKDYNDRHGHLAGDAALRAVAQALQSAMRPQDLVARYGGEEFACLMVDADRETTLRVAERMRALVEALPPRTLGNDDYSVTLSGGALNAIPQSGELASDLLRRADAALYAAKRAGRNRVLAAD